MPDVIGDLAVNTRVHLPLLLAHEAAGAPGTRHSPRPLFFGRTLMAKARAMCAARTRGCGFSSLRAQRSDPHLLCLAMDCFAALAMTALGYCCLTIESLMTSCCGRGHGRNTHSVSSPRTRGPIIPVVCCGGGRSAVCQNAGPRRMGPGVRRDDGERVAVTTAASSAVALRAQQPQQPRPGRQPLPPPHLHHASAKSPSPARDD
jgi:hypothetical protein